MMFDYSITKLKRVRCSNHECQHVFKVYDRREPIINDPGFVVVKCPVCQNETRFKVWNIDYFKKRKDVIATYEDSEESQNEKWLTCKLGECLEQDLEEIYKDNDIVVAPKVSFWSLMGQKDSLRLNDKLRNDIDEKLKAAENLWVSSKICMMGVDAIFVKVYNRKNACRDYFVYAKRPLMDNSFNTDDFFPIHKGNVSLEKRIDGLFTRDECLSILDFCLRRWAITSKQVVIAVPFIGLPYKNNRCKNQVLYFWAFLNSVLEMNKTMLFTRKTEFYRMREYLNEQKEKETYDFRKYWGKLDKLQTEADIASNRRCGKSKKFKQMANQHVFFTNTFHSKFYAGIYDNSVELLVGSYNVHEGNVLENLTFKKCSISDFNERYLERILPGVDLLVKNEDNPNLIDITVFTDKVKYGTMRISEYIKEYLR